VLIIVGARLALDLPVHPKTGVSMVGAATTR
jgi:hypothetical protein